MANPDTATAIFGQLSPAAGAAVISRPFPILLSTLSLKPNRKIMQPVQADSLSTIMRLADNPPAYVNPTAPVLPSLILYIVRVPGSQDLFLTTLHPLASTVTGEDINACLYYIHIHPSTNTPQPSHLAVRPTSHRRWSSQSLRSPRWHKPASTLPTMTIVRRDPASGAQWNVARVSQIPPAPNPSSSSQSSTPDPNDGILLEVTTQGYGKFLPPKLPPYHPPPATSGHAGGPDLSWKDFAYGSPEAERAEWEARRREQLQVESRQSGMGNVVDDERSLDEPEERVFRREMLLEGVGFWSRVRGIGGHRRSESRDGSNGGDNDENQKKEKAKKRGYVFEALWGAGTAEGTGKCGFKDEAAGKYLKCKYYPPAVGSAPQQSSLLSVIEFKPPSTTAISSSSHSRASSPSTDIGTVAPETLLSSKSKLGMLVLHSDGQYMMDLLVAANMAVFWRRWESWAAERLALGVAGR